MELAQCANPALPPLMKKPGQGLDLALLFTFLSS